METCYIRKLPTPSNHFFNSLVSNCLAKFHETEFLFSVNLVCEEFFLAVKLILVHRINFRFPLSFLFNSNTAMTSCSRTSEKIKKCCNLYIARENSKTVYYCVKRFWIINFLPLIKKLKDLCPLPKQIIGLIPIV